MILKRSSKLMGWNYEQFKTIIEMEKMDTMEVSLTRDQVKSINKNLRHALRNGVLPFRWQDEHERRYRRIVYEMGLETGRQFKVTKVGVNWMVEDVGERKK